MERLEARAGWFVVAGVLMISATTVAQNDIEDPSAFGGAWYRIAFDGNGSYVGGDGHGYAGGTWYFYPQTGWWRQWYYNEPFSTSRQGYLEYQVYIKALDRGLPSTAEVQFNWSTPQWSDLHRNHPPRPEDASTVNAESMYMQSKHLFSVDNALIGTIEPIATCTIREYNPEWVSIDIRGKNVCIYRGAFHACLAQDSPVGACYDSRTGQCTTCLEGECLPPCEWQGPGTSCPALSPPSPAPMYRLWSTVRAIHFYTTSKDERDRLLGDPVDGWADEGIAWHALPAGNAPDCLPVHGFRSTTPDVHFYTISEPERQALVDNYGDYWTYEGVAFYAYPEDTQPDTAPVYRFWSGALAHHFYTMSAAERDFLISNYAHVWQYEGIAWYAYPP